MGLRADETTDAADVRSCDTVCVEGTGTNAAAVPAKSKNRSPLNDPMVQRWMMFFYFLQRKKNSRIPGDLL